MLLVGLEWMHPCCKISDIFECVRLRDQVVISILMSIFQTPLAALKRHISFRVCAHALARTHSHGVWAYLLATMVSL